MLSFFKKQHTVRVHSLSVTAYPSQNRGEAGVNPSWHWVRAGFTRHRADIWRKTIVHTYIHTAGNLETPINQTCMSLDYCQSCKRYYFPVNWITYWFQRARQCCISPATWLWELTAATWDNACDSTRCTAAVSEEALHSALLVIWVHFW